MGPLLREIRCWWIVDVAKPDQSPKERTVLNWDPISERERAGEWLMGK